MSKSWAAVIVTGLIPLAIGCSNGIDSRQSATPDNGVDLSRTVILGAPHSEIDLGLIDTVAGTKIVCWFENTLGRTLKVRKIATSCGCLKVEKFPEEVKAGERMPVVLLADARRSAADFEQRLSVVCEDESGEEFGASTRVRGIVRGVFLDQLHVRLGQVAVGHRTVVSGQIVGHSSDVRLTLSGLGLLDVIEQTIEGVNDASVQRFRFVLAVRQSAKSGMFDEQLQLKVQVDERSYEESLSITGQVKGPIRIIPQSLILKRSNEATNNGHVLSIVGDGSCSLADLRLNYDKEVVELLLVEASKNHFSYRVISKSVLEAGSSVGEISLLQGDQCIGRVPLVVVP